MAKVTAIETEYRNYRFRSRVEARTAVFLDHAGITWRYEHQGWNLPSGRYLPDFELGPEGEPAAFLEIKGPKPTTREFTLAAEVSEHLGPCMIWSGGMKLVLEGGEARGWVYAHGTWTATDPGKALDTTYIGGPFFHGGEGEELYAAALVAARSARFEHGENGREEK